MRFLTLHKTLWKGNYLVKLNVQFLMFLGSFIVGSTASIVRSATVVFSAIGLFFFGFWCFYSVRLVLVLCHITVSQSILYCKSKTDRDTVTHSLTHPTTHTLTHSLTQPPTHSLTHSPNHPHSHSLTHPTTHTLTHSLTQPPIYSLTHPTTHPLTHSPNQPPNHSFTQPPTHSLTPRRITE
jgi:hypothetical protein